MKPFLYDLQFGNKGIDVYRLQDFLEVMGYGDFIPTGFFGPKTFEAVRQFQRDNRITDTGYLGPITREIINTKFMNATRRENIFEIAKASLGHDASPADIAPDEYGCAESVTTILEKAGCQIPIIVSTYKLFQFLESSNAFIKVDQPMKGDVIISPSGYGNGNLSNGHVGIVGEIAEMFVNTLIMSNESSSGRFMTDYNILSWKERYQKLGGYPVVFFRAL